MAAPEPEPPHQGTQDVSIEEDKPQKVTYPGFRHEYAGLKDEAFFRHIDACGGWPLDYPFVGFAHSDKREAAFTMTPVRSGWWTTTHHRDDYLMWKLSPEAWTRIFYAVREDLSSRLSRQGALIGGPQVKGWRSGITPLHPDFEERLAKAVADRAKNF